MGRRTVAVLSALLTGTALSGAGQEPQRPRFRAGEHAVSIYATVVDADGGLVTDLTAADFEVLDDGRVRDLSLFSNSIQPITIVVMLDRSGSVERRFSQVRDAASAFIGQLQPADRARIGTFSGRVDILPAAFTSDPHVLREIVYGEVQDPGPTPLWNATSAAIDALAAESGRRVVLVFTDGVDSPWFEGTNVSFDSVRSRVEGEDVMVYGVGLAERCALPPPTRQRPADASTPPPDAGAAAQVQVTVQGRGRGRGGRPRFPPGFPPSRPPVMPPPPRIPAPADPRGGGADVGSPCEESQPDPQLRELTDLSGGGYAELTTTANLPRTFARIADELHRQYLLAFTADQLDGRTHRIEVRVRRPGLAVRARTSYRAPAATGVGR